MNKKIPFIIWTGVALGAVIAMYALGWITLRDTDLEYRLWIDSIGKCLIFLGIPLWGVCAVWTFFRKKDIRRMLAVPITVLLVILYLGWSGWYLFYLLFSVHSEYRINGEYFIVDTFGGLGKPVWRYYESEGIFFRRPCDEKAVKRQYLEEKYGEKFQSGPLTGEMKLYSSDISEGWFSDSHPEVPVHVFIRGQQLEDDYVKTAAQYIFYQTCIEEQSVSGYTWQDGTFYLLLRENAPEQFCEDAAILIQAAERDPLVEKWGSVLAYKIVLGKDPYYYGGALSFGGSSSGGIKEQNLYEIAEQRIRSVREEAERRRVNREEAAREKAEQDSKETSEETYCREAEEIYRQTIEPQGIGTGFGVSYNAKGFPYYDLGTDGEYAYTLIYYKDSANGNCHLYVLYKSPKAPSGDRYVNYTDGATLIADIFAYETETGKIVASGRRSWSDAGTEEYRQITGE